MPFPSTINATAIGAGQGFAIVNSVEGLGVQTATIVGDVNGDGIADYVVGDPEAGSNAGALYVVFGTGTTETGTFDLATLDGTNGFRLNGGDGDRLAYAVAAADDINGDGFADLLVYARQGLGMNSDNGKIYLLFGGSTFNATLDLTSLDGSDGMVIDGLSGNDSAELSFSAAGDVNGDGIGDFIVGEQYSNVGAPYSGAAYIVFGTDNGLPAEIDLATLDGSNGFTFTGPSFSALGGQVAAIGDINADGIDDVAVQRYQYSGYQAITYVLYGSTEGFDATLNLNDIDGTNGFRLVSDIEDDYFGHSIQRLGDINGDGIDDLAISAPYGLDNGVVYVVFGSASGFEVDTNVADLDGTNGFKIITSTPYGFGAGLAGGGDINGDGMGDLVISAVYVGQYSGRQGEVYALLGHHGPFDAVVDIASLDGTNGFRFVGPTNGYAGDGTSIAGDLNGDGIDDLIVTTRFAGTTYVIYGQPDNAAVNFGTVGADRLEGGGGNDLLRGFDGKDVLFGLNGSDSLYGEDSNDVVYGEGGDDYLDGGLGNDILDGGDGVDSGYGGDGADKLFGGAGDDLLLGEAGADRMDGGADADRLEGGDGNDYLDGGQGNDTLIGGLGNDVFIVDNLADVTTEAAGQGYDIVRTALDGWVLGPEIEGLELQGSADIDGTGNGGANNLQGNAGANRLDGGAGVDTINGNDGDDIIVGGVGNDLLRGGTGADTFVVAHAFGAVLETDQVYDFSAAEGDILDLTDAYAGTLALVSSFSKQAGQMTLTFAGGITTLRLDVNGDGKVDYQMKINGDATGESGNWLL